MMERKTARIIALDLLAACRRDRSWSDGYLKAAIRKNGLDSRDAALTTRLGYGVLQNAGLLDFYIGCYCSQQPGHLEPVVLDVLRLGAYQILFMDRVPDSAAVSESVELVKRSGKERAAGMVNAVLRKISANREHLPEIPGRNRAEYLSVRYSHPLWLVQRCLTLLGEEEAEAFLRCNNEAVATAIQWNPLRGTEEALQKALREAGVQICSHPWLSGCYEISKTGDLTQLDAFRNGLFLVQDAAARLTALAADVRPGMTVLDLCAAPGGKSFALAMAMQNRGTIRSFDLHKSKIRLIQESAARLGITCIQAQSADGKVFQPELEKTADVVLCDVPCSGLGIIRKKPDIRYHEPSAELPALQRAILAQQAEYVRPGGVLLYSTCTILRRENEAVAEDFLRTHPDFVPENAPWPEGSGIAPGAMVTLLPGQHETDGFFICKFRRKP